MENHQQQRHRQQAHPGGGRTGGSANTLLSEAGGGAGGAAASSTGGHGGGGGFMSYDFDSFRYDPTSGGASGASSGLFTFDPSEHQQLHHHHHHQQQQQPAHKRRRQDGPDAPEVGAGPSTFDPAAGAAALEDSLFSFSTFGSATSSATPSSASPSAGRVHLQPLPTVSGSAYLQFPSTTLQLHTLPTGGSGGGVQHAAVTTATTAGGAQLPSPPLPLVGGSATSATVPGDASEERRALAEERQQLVRERQQLADERRVLEQEKRKFEEEKKRWLEERDKQPQTTTTTTSKPSFSLYGRRTRATLEEQSFGCAFIKNSSVITKPSTAFAQAFVILQDMLTEKSVEVPLAVGVGAKDSSLSKKLVQTLGCILIPQQTRDYGPSYAKTGYLTVQLKDQKGGVAVRIEAVESNEGGEGEAYFIITKGDLATLGCTANEKEGVISNDVSGSGGETTGTTTKGKRKK